MKKSVQKSRRKYFFLLGVFVFLGFLFLHRIPFGQTVRGETLASIPCPVGHPSWKEAPKIEGGFVTLKWTKAINATGYALYCREEGKAPTTSCQYGSIKCSVPAEYTCQKPMDEYYQYTLALNSLKPNTKYECYARAFRLCYSGGNCFSDYEDTPIQQFTTPGGATLTPTPTSPTATPTLSVCPQKPKGDANCDNKITLLDFEIWREEAKDGKTPTQADFNQDGVINDLDYQIWQDNFQ